MEDADFLLAIAEVAVAFAGFASLVTALRDRAGGDHPAVQATRFRGMVILSLTVVAFSLVPFVLPRLGLSAGASWQLASGLFLLAGVAALWKGSRETAALGADDEVVQPPGAVLRTTASLGALWVAILMLAAAALGLFASATQGVYAVALLLFLLSAGILFVSLLFAQLAPPATRPRNPADDEDMERS